MILLTVSRLVILFLSIIGYLVFVDWAETKFKYRIFAISIGFMALIFAIIGFLSFT